MPAQFKLPWIVLVTYSFPSGSVSTLLFRFTEPFTWLRMNPNQKPSYPLHGRATVDAVILDRVPGDLERSAKRARPTA